MTNSINIGDRVVLGHWAHFKSVVSDSKEIPGDIVQLTIVTCFPIDDYFKWDLEASKVYLHDEGKTWHRMSQHSWLEVEG
jgi:hypothetical protein